MNVDINLEELRNRVIDNVQKVGEENNLPTKQAISRINFIFDDFKYEIDAIIYAALCILVSQLDEEE